MAYQFHKDIPDSKLKIYEEVGHMPMEERPGSTARDAVAFINQINQE